MKTPAHAALAAIVVALALASLNSYDNEFLWDDDRLITRNAWLDRGPWLEAFRHDYYAIPGDDLRLGYYRPLTLLSNRLDFVLHGRHPAGWHLSNWLLHLGASFLLHALALRLSGSRAAAGIAAALFALAAIHAESVTFISGRVDVLATLFGLGSILAAVAARPWLAALLWLPALLSKEVAIVVPVLAALALLVCGEGSRRERLGRIAGLARRCVPVFAVYLALRLGAIGVLSPRGETSPAAATLARALNVHAFYWTRLLLPSAAFDVEPPLPGGEAFAAGRALLALLPPLAGLVLLRRARVVSLGLLWVSVALLPVSQLVRLETAVSSRYAYLASAGVALAVGAALGRAGRAGLVLGCLLAAMQGALLAHRNEHFQDPVSFHAARRRLAPDDQPAALNLASSLVARGEREAALVVLREAVARWPEDPAPRSRLGLLALEAGRGAEAADNLARAAADQPLALDLHLALGVAELMRGEPGRASSAYRRALLADARSAPAAAGLAASRMVEAERGGDPCAALEAYRMARSRDPGSPLLAALEPAAGALAARCREE